MQYDFFTASDGAQIHRTHWPCNNPNAFVHIVHGMAEHCDRYHELACRLNAEGFAVYAHDQRGHARTAEKAGVELGNIATQAERSGGKMGVLDGDGFLRMVLDLEEMLLAEKQTHEGLKCMLLGHSMGSVVAQMLAGKSGSAVGLDALVLSGTPARPVFPLSTAVPVLVQILSLLSGGIEGITSIPTTLSFGEFAKNTRYTSEEQALIDEGKLPKTEFDWLSHDPKEVAKYIEDDHCGHLFTVGYWKDFLSNLLKLASNPTAMAGLSDSTPMMVIVGGSDPCHEAYRALDQIATEFHNADKKMPKVVVVGEGRHELFNERQPEREQAISEVIRFFSAALVKARM